jgi:hypothetical protein
LAGASIFTATLGLLDLHCVNDVELRELRNIGYNISFASPRWAAYIVEDDLFQREGDKYNDIVPDSPFPQSLLSHGCLYMMSTAIQNKLVLRRRRPQRKRFNWLYPERLQDYWPQGAAKH